MSYVFRRLSCRPSPTCLRPPALSGPTFRPTRFCDLGNTCSSTRGFSTTAGIGKDKYEEKARELSQQGLDEHEQEVKARKNQIQRPWLRQDADKPPVEKAEKETEPLTKGSLSDPVH